MQPSITLIMILIIIILSLINRPHSSLGPSGGQFTRPYQRVVYVVCPISLWTPSTTPCRRPRPPPPPPPRATPRRRTTPLLPTPRHRQTPTPTTPTLLTIRRIRQRRKTPTTHHPRTPHLAQPTRLRKPCSTSPISTSPNLLVPLHTANMSSPFTVRWRGGDATEYFESRIALPRSLQGLKTGHVIARLMANNPALDAEKWSCVTADVVGSNLIIGTVNKVGRELIDGLGEVKVEPGRTAKVPPASKPNNLYHVEILLPYERELHVEFMEAFLQSFPSAKFISMPGKKPFGTTRRLRIYFNTTTAPREVFTEDDHTIPIREVTLPCGTAAQIIHKWQRLNQFRPPHLSNRWHQQSVPRSYAAAASPNPAPQNNESTNPNGLSNHTASITHPPQPIRRTGEVPTGPSINTTSPTVPPPANVPPSANITPALANTTNNRNPDQADWMSDEPFPPSQQQATHHSDQTRNMEITSHDRVPQSRNAINPPTPHSCAPVLPETNQHPPSVTNAPTNQSRIPNPPSSNDKTYSTSKPSSQPSPPPPPQRANTKAYPSAPQPTTTTDPRQWQSVKRSRSRTASQSTQPAANPTLRRSASRSRKSKQTNKFAPLDFEIIPSFEDDEIAPIEVTLHEKPIRPPRRKYKPSKKAITKQAAEALTHPQLVRHPANSLQYLSPKQTQVVLRSKDPALSPQRDNLIRQIALLRAARTNTNQRNITLDPTADEAFIQQVQSRLADCDEPPQCDQTTSIDVPLSSILDRDEARVRRYICYAWVDLASRAILPHLYDAWPDPPSWNGTTLNWLPSTDGETPCLHDEALACLAACPSLNNVWTHLATSTPELEAAIRTTATQWHMFNADQNTLGTKTPTPSTHKQ